MTDLSGYSDDQLAQIAGMNLNPGNDISSMSDDDLIAIAGQKKPGLFDNFGDMSLEKSIAPETVIPGITSAIVSPLTNLASKVYDIDKNLFTRAFPNASIAIGGAVDKAAQVEQNINSNPYIKTLMQGPVMEAAKNTAAVAPVIPATSIGGALLKSGTELAASPVLSVADKLNQSKKIKQLQEVQKSRTAALREESGSNFGLARSENLQVSPEDISKLDNSLSSLVPKEHMEQNVWNNSEASKHVNEIRDSLQTENPSFNGLLSKRTELNSKIKVADRAGNDNEARLLRQVKDSLDNVMMNENTGTWQKANHQWAQQATLDDLDEMVNRASSRLQPANSLDTEINNYLRKNGRYLSDDEYIKLQSVAENTATDKLKKTAASGLWKFAGTGIGAMGGPIGAGIGFLVTHYGSEAAKDALMLSKLKKLDEFRDMIISRDLPEVIKKEKPQTLMLTDRGEAARKAEAQAKAQEKLAEGRTGGVGTQNLFDKEGNPLPESYPQSGPYVGRTAGDVPYNYYGPNVSVLQNLNESLRGIKKGQLSNMALKLKSGELSQNKFIENSMKSFGINNTQARNLAKEIKAGNTTENIAQKLKNNRGKQ